MHRQQTATQHAALAFALGDESPEVLAELRARLLRWADQRDDALPLNRVLSLGSTRATRLAMRDALLVEASELLAGTRWARCKLLAELGRTFHARRYDVWRRHGIPDGASEVDLLLYRACELGESMPKTPEQFLSILPPPA